ncbi:hypothetical protein BK717_20280 [Bacillus thuringiensis serovar malayensis]|uniref:BppU family phage baseplate upper protein n=1 Tax=Bacillus toyonensis TaxID=155322 RepID=UPI000B4373F3|nr:BppU family phage baseplate upper protein [Bacillus toyonensis]MEC2390218.1 BppU family phage baseplate upper protein [Bacillus toyonensis]OTX32077.1 hypothetical protein BK717_20280 [Bacillus thuringiensis serovar malayensis]
MVNSIFKTYEVTVDTMRDSSVSQVMRYSQNDLKSAKILITVNHNGKEEDFSEATAVRVSFEKGDKKIVYQDCQPINVLKGKYQVLLTTQTLTSVGIVTANVHIYFPNDKKIETGSFTFEVVESKMSDEVIKSTDAFPAIHKAIEAGEQLKDIDIQALIASKTTAEAVNKKADKNAVQIGDLQKSLCKQDVKTQTLQHGPNVVNATVASPLNVEVQGRTLVNLLGQTTLDLTKYYLFMPNKGTTKITAGGSSYDGVAKFTGQSAVTYTIKQDFRGKVSRSTLENGHVQKANVASTSLLVPSAFASEEPQWRYDRITSLNAEPNSESAGANLCIAQILISFNIIRALQDKFGIQIWKGKTALADKLAIAKQLIVDYTATLYANGSSPRGNTLYIKRWIPSTSTWFGSTTTTGSNLTKVQTGSTNVQEIDSDGFIHVIAYADASDGTRPSVVNIDYAMLELKTKMETDTPMLEDALYEVDQTTYNKVNVDPEFSGKNLVDKFPYVEGVQHLNPVMVVDGVNLLPSFTEWVVHVNAMAKGNNTLELHATANNQASTFSVPAFGNTAYNFSIEEMSSGGRFVIYEHDSLGRYLNKSQVLSSAGNREFTTDINTSELRVILDNGSSGIGKFIFEKAMINLRDKKPFTPQNKSYLYTNTVLAGYNGVNDVLYKEDGQWKALRKWEREVPILGDSIDVGAVTSGANGSDFKEAVLPKIGKNQGLRNNQFIMKPNGQLNTNVKPEFSGGKDSFYLEPSNGNVYYRVPNEDTGFTQAYLPIGDEIKAYFNGWKVKTTDANGKPTAWLSLVDGNDAPTQTLAYVKANKAPNYIPYKLTYQLATPRVENIQVEGDLVVDGLTQITIESGVVIREKVTPVKQSEASGTLFQINRKDQPMSFTKKRVSKFIAVYKNNVIDLKWRFVVTPSVDNGLIKAVIAENDFDPKAEYTVTYLVLDKHLFTTNVLDVKTSYNQSVRSTVDELTVKQADTVTGLSILQNLMTDVLARLKANSL